MAARAWRQVVSELLAGRTAVCYRIRANNAARFCIGISCVLCTRKRAGEKKGTPDRPLKPRSIGSRGAFHTLFFRVKKSSVSRPTLFICSLTAPCYGWQVLWCLSKSLPSGWERRNREVLGCTCELCIYLKSMRYRVVSPFTWGQVGVTRP